MRLKVFARLGELYLILKNDVVFVFCNDLVLTDARFSRNLLREFRQLNCQNIVFSRLVCHEIFEFRRPDVVYL